MAVYLFNCTLLASCVCLPCSLEAALASPTIPPEIVTSLLNLAEFMEHDDKRLPLDTRTLGALAEKCHAFAKALHYKVRTGLPSAHLHSHTVILPACTCVCQGTTKWVSIQTYASIHMHMHSLAVHTLLLGA